MKPIRLALAALLALAAPQAASAVFHFAVIDEVMTSYGGDPAVQFVEIRMETAGQGQVGNSVLARFDADGNYQGDVLIVPGDVANAGTGARWIMGTTAFETAAGIQVDFEFAPGLFTGGGMVCWGAPGLSPPAPTWDRTQFTNYVDCVAYGAYSGPTNVRIGTPTPLAPDGHSLVRVDETHDNETDFACGDPATPTNNDGDSVELAPTIPCPEPAAPLLLATGALALLTRGRARRRRPARAERA